MRTDFLDRMGLVNIAAADSGSAQILNSAVGVMLPKRVTSFMTPRVAVVKFEPWKT